MAGTQRWGMEPWLWRTWWYTTCFQDFPNWIYSRDQCRWRFYDFHQLKLFPTRFRFMLVKFYKICSDVGSKEPWVFPMVWRFSWKIGSLNGSVFLWVDELCRCPISFHKHWQFFPTIFSPKKRFAELECFWCMQMRLKPAWLNKIPWTQFLDQQAYVKQNTEAPRCYRGVKFQVSLINCIAPWLGSDQCWSEAAKTKLLVEVCSWKVCENHSGKCFWKGFPSLKERVFLQ